VSVNQTSWFGTAFCVQNARNSAAWSDSEVVLQLDALHLAAALFGQLAAGVVDENVPHGLGGDC
jgi:hypothetical protein